MANFILHRYRDLSFEQFVAYLTPLEGQPVVTVMVCAGWDDETGEKVGIAKGTVLIFAECYLDLHPPHDDITHCCVYS